MGCLSDLHLKKLARHVHAERSHRSIERLAAMFALRASRVKSGLSNPAAK
jgi:hypothetical protein